MEGVDKKEKLDCMTADLLVKELRSQFDSGKTRTYLWRMNQLKGIFRMIKEHEFDIIEALKMDLSKPEFEAFITEIATLKTSCKLAIKKLRNWMKPKRVKTSLLTFPSSASIVSEPLGIVLVISTWNYPFLISLDPVIGAIAAGNTVVLKPSEIAPSTSALLSKLLQKYVDRTCVRVVEGSVDETRALLDQKWDKIFYTGSGRVGRIVMAAAAKHLTPVVLELGGKCPAVVDPNSDLKVAAKRIVAGKWGSNNGQTCISPDYLITTRDFAPKLIESIKWALSNMYGKGKDLLGCQEMSRIVNLQHFTRLNNLLCEDGVSDKIVWGGQSEKKLLRIAPTVLLDVPENSMMMTEEIFGPLLPVVTVETLDESFGVIQSKPKPLAAYLFTNNNQLKKRFISNISAGAILVNDTILHFTLNSLPFGGVGESGTGSCHGKFSFDAFSQKKAVLNKSFHLDVSVRYPPYTPSKVTTFKALNSNNTFHKMVGLIRVSKDLVMDR